MADHRPGHQRILPHEILDEFKWEVAAQDGLAGKISAQGWPAMSSSECGHIGGRIGGRLVKVLIRNAEEALTRGSAH